MSKKYETVKVSTKAQMIIDLLQTDLEGKPGFRLTNGEIAKLVRDQFEGSGRPGKGTTPACIAWYASKLKNPEFAIKYGIENYQPRMAYKA